jgi:hypothetical protein
LRDRLANNAFIRAPDEIALHVHSKKRGEMQAPPPIGEAQSCHLETWLRFRALRKTERGSSFLKDAPAPTQHQDHSGSSNICRAGRSWACSCRTITVRTTEKRKMPVSSTLGPPQSTSRRVTAVGHWPTACSQSSVGDRLPSVTRQPPSVECHPLSVNQIPMTLGSP